MKGDAWLYLFAMILNAGLLFGEVFFTIMFSDLEVDYINPIDLCNRLNRIILPDMAAQWFLTGIFLLTGRWFSLLLNLPVALFHGNLFMKNQYLLDATEIFRTLGKHKRESFFKLGFYLLVFFFYLYSMIVALVSSDE